MIKRLDSSSEAVIAPSLKDIDLTPANPLPVAQTADLNTSTAFSMNVAPAVTTAAASMPPLVAAELSPGNQYAPAPQLPMSSTGADLSAVSDINSDIVSRKMSLEELKFELDRERARHQMKMELRKEQFREDELRREEEKEDSKQGEHWMKAYWRPAMGWLYMLICAFDFIIAPMLSMAMPLYLKYLGATTVAYAQWQSLTLANGGLIHLAFGAILGVTAWTRGQEKLAKMG